MLLPSQYVRGKKKYNLPRSSAICEGSLVPRPSARERILRATLNLTSSKVTYQHRARGGDDVGIRYIENNYAPDFV